VSRAPGSALDPVPVVNKCPGNSDGPEPFRLSDEAPASHGAAAERRYGFALKRSCWLRPRTFVMPFDRRRRAAQLTSPRSAAKSKTDAWVTLIRSH
jgi:hypothetical protein